MSNKIVIYTIIIVVILGLAGFFGFHILENELQQRQAAAGFVPEDIDIDLIQDDFDFAEALPPYQIKFDGLVAQSRQLTFSQLLEEYSSHTETKTVEGIRSDGKQIEVAYTGIRMEHILKDLSLEEQAQTAIVYATDLYAADFSVEELYQTYLVWKKEGQYMNPSQDGVLKIVQDQGPTSKWVKNPVLFSFISSFEDLVSEDDRMDADWLEFASEQTMFTLSIGPVPQIDADDWALSIEGLVENPATLDYDSLKTMDHESVYATLETISNPIGGQMIGNAVWGGVPFRQILELAEPKQAVIDVVFYCRDGYSTSITIQEAGQPGVLLAYQMNGRTLPDNHGFPVRMVIPSKYGMKWAMWIDRIEFVDYDYKGFWESRGWSDYAGRDRPDQRFD